jgi:tellurite methyltransferase
MQRHAGLQGLSRDHHHALVLARRLRSAVDPAAGAADDQAAFLAEVHAAWDADVVPHFAVEERELLPLCHGAGPDLEAHAETIRGDHAALRSLLADLLVTASFAGVAAAMAARLEAHVRFEERVWFPALEAALDDDVLAALTWRLEPQPRVPITGFRRDETEPAEAWVATLACGHSQHVRHRPPFQNAEWVTTEQGRTSQLGTRLPCVLCRMPRLPPRAAVYKETPVFDQQSVPGGLLASHTLRAGTWGQIVVIAGKLDYVIEDVPARAFVLAPGVDGAVAPESPHHVRLQIGARFKVRFLR